MCIRINRKTIKEHERDSEERKEGRGKKKGGKAQPLFPKQVKHHYLPLITGLSIFIFFFHLFCISFKTQPLHPFIIKTLRTKTEGNFLDLINSIYENPTASIIVNSGRKNAFLPRPETRQEYLLLTLLFNKGLKGLARSVKQENKIKCIQTGKEVKLIYR